LSLAVRRVSIVAFARVQHNPKLLGAAFLRALGLLACVAIPAGAALSALAQPLLHAIYGTKWDASAPALRFLAFFGIARVLLDLGYDALVAAGHGRRVLILQAAWLALLIPALVIGGHVDGIRGVAAAHVGLAVGVIIPIFIVSLRQVRVTWHRIRAVVGRAILAGAAITALVAATQEIDQGPWPQLAVGSLGALAAFAVVVAPGKWLRKQISAARAIA
jgi:PST family polysaccharide transporter